MTARFALPMDLPDRNRLRELNDPRLLRLIEATDDAAREAAIALLLTAEVAPVVQGVLARIRKAEPGLRAEDLEEIGSHVSVCAMRKLRAAARFEEHAIAALDGYVATLTYHAAYDLRRQRHPERHRLKKKLRHAFSRDDRLALWETPATIAAGLSGWKGRSDVLMSIHPIAPAKPMQDEDNPGDAAVAILSHIGAPVGFDAFVDAVGELWNVRDAVMEPDAFPADTRRDALGTLEQRQYLAALWSEIVELPPNQRIALLLNLRDANGTNALVLFLVLDIAGVQEIAAAAEMSEEEFSALWEQLPLSDLSLASRLGLTRQQVINLRSAARARLTRRLGGWK